MVKSLYKKIEKKPNFVENIIKRNSILHKIVLLAVLILGFSLRIIEVINQNYLFGFDQGRDYLRVYDIVVNHKLTLIGTELGSGFAVIGGIFQGPFYYYTIAIPFILFRGDPYGALILMFVFGIITLFLTYFLTVRFFGKWGAVLATFLIAVSSRIVDQSRFQWNAHLTSIFVLLSLYFSLLISQRPLVFLPLSLFFAGFIYNYEIALSVPMVISILIYSAFILKRKIIKAYLLGVIALIISYAPFLLFEARHQLALSGFIKYFFQPKAHEEANYGTIAREHLTDFWNNAQVTFLVDNQYLTLILFAMIFIFSIYYYFRSNDSFFKKLVLLSFIMVIINFVIFLFLRSTVWNYYLTELHFIYIFLLSGIFVISIKRHNFLLSGFLSIFILVMFFNSIKMVIKDYKYDYYDYGGVHKIKGKLDALDYIYTDAKGKDFGLFVFAPSIYTFPYDYLIKWYGNKKYNYVPSEDKTGLFYLLIEPDEKEGWRHKGWMETVIKTGKVVETKKLKSGLIVQKRITEKN